MGILAAIWIFDRPQSDILLRCHFTGVPFRIGRDYRHHRNQMAMKDIILAYISTPDIAQAIIKARDVEYVIGCPAAYEMLLYRYRAPDGLWAQLMAGKAPDWLIPQEDIGAFRVWHVNQKKLKDPQ